MGTLSQSVSNSSNPQLAANRTPTEINQAVGHAKPGNRTWKLLGKTVSAKCLARILGIRTQRLDRAGSGKLDLRYGCFGSATCYETKKRDVFSILLPRTIPINIRLTPKNRAGPKVRKRRPLKYMKLDRFFLQLYIDMAGMMPDRLLWWF